MFLTIAAHLTEENTVNGKTVCNTACRRLLRKQIRKPVLYTPKFQQVIRASNRCFEHWIGGKLEPAAEEGKENPILIRAKNSHLRKRNFSPLRKKVQPSYML